MKQKVRETIHFNINCLTEPFALDVLILLYVTVELDQYKIFEIYGFIAQHVDMPYLCLLKRGRDGEVVIEISKTISDNLILISGNDERDHF